MGPRSPILVLRRLRSLGLAPAVAVDTFDDDDVIFDFQVHRGHIVVGRRPFPRRCRLPVAVLQHFVTFGYSVAAVVGVVVVGTVDRQYVRRLFDADVVVVAELVFGVDVARLDAVHLTAAVDVVAVQEGHVGHGHR